MSDKELGLQFPCEFDIKAMGLATPEFDSVVVGIIRKHAPDINEGAVTSRPSKGGKYLSVTVTIEATSMDQLNAIYDDLTEHELVLMRL